MGKPKAPAAPDPVKTAEAQTGTNISTAIANGYLGNYNQVTPEGKLTYSTEGYETVTDGATGKQYQVPIRTATQTLSPEQQAIYDQNTGANLNLATLGNNLSGTLGQKLTGNFTVGNESTEARLAELGRNRLDPQFAQQDEALRTRLANQGIRVGTEAYDREMTNFGQRQNDAYNQLYLNGRGQATQEQFAEDNQRINQISALMSGGQVSQPNFVNPQGSQAATTDYAGIVNQGFQNQMGIYGQQMNNWNQAAAAVGNVASNAIMLSDRRAKKDIKKVGNVKGLGVYEYRYKGAEKGSPIQMGLMAQEVKKRTPDAIVDRPDGLMAVDYSKALKG